MTQLQNQFGLSAQQGLQDMRFGGSVISGQVDTSSAGGLIAGQPVKMVDSSGGVPKFVECAADTDDVFGFIVLNAKNATYAVGDRIEVACLEGAVMYMTSSAAIARNAKVAIVLSGTKVVTAGTAQRVVGRALDKATAANQLIRVVIKCPGALLAADVAANATAAATDLASAEALANSLQTTVNAILTSLKNAGIMS